MSARIAVMFGLVVTISTLTACGGSGVSTPAPGLQPSSIGAAQIESTRADVRLGLTPEQVQRSRAAASPGHWAHPNAKAPTLFVSDLNGDPAQIRIYPANVTDPRQSSNITAGLDLPINIAVDKHGTLYVANNGNATVTEYPFGATTPSVTLSSQLVDPNGIAVDSHGTVYVTSGSTIGSCYVLEFAKGATTPNAQINGFGLPIGLAVDKNDNLYVADAAAPYAVWEVAAGSTTPTNLGLSSLNDPTGAALDDAGDLYISNYQSNVLAYHAGQTSPYITISDGVKNPYALGFSSKSTLFVADYGNSTVSAYKKNKTTDFEAFGNGIVTPVGIALYKPSKD